MVRSQLFERGIRNASVLRAMQSVPRHQFVSEFLSARAYDDAALPAACGQTISQPFMVARMTELLDLRPDSRVLEIGTGTGYQTAILAALVPSGHVFSIEWHLELMTAAAARVRELGYPNVEFRCGDGTIGWSERAPFDAIIVTAGGPDVPPALIDQLSPAGRLVVPVGPLDAQTLLLIRNTSRGPVREELLQCRFVKLVGAAGWPA